MRVIDADKLMESLKPNESVWVGLVLSELIANATTVKAIPVEFIEKYIDHRLVKYGDTWTFINCMLNDWEKENAIN